MERKVIAILQSLDEKDEYIEKLKRMEGINEDDVKIISKKDSEADLYPLYFKRGDYLLTVESNENLAKTPEEKRAEIDNIETLREEKNSQIKGDF